MTRRRDPYQADLLSWTPPQPVVRFEPDQVRAASFDQRLCKAMALALKEARTDRALIAERMSTFLGKEVTKAMLDAYVSPARNTHQISVSRFFALLHVTQDRRLLELLAEPFGWAVVDERHADAIAEVELAEKRDEIERQLQLRRMKRRGAR
ncbi:MAG: DNA transposition protein [Proteobacteria bacterium]|nr:DNA transposition protein [Pseudomonadota bacterium]